MKCKNMDQLITEYKRLRPQEHYFDRDTLAFFGESIDTMKSLGVETIRDRLGNKVEVYVINRWQEGHPLGSRYSKAYFDTETLEDLSPYSESGEVL